MLISLVLSPLTPPRDLEFGTFYRLNFIGKIQPFFRESYISIYAFTCIFKFPTFSHQNLFTR